MGTQLKKGNSMFKKKNTCSYIILYRYLYNYNNILKGFPVFV